MRRLVSREEGTAAVELGMILPILLVFLAFFGPLVKFGYEYMVLQRAVSHGVRYASRADVNAQTRSDGSVGRRPIPAEVRSFVSDSADGMVPAAAVDVTPDPTLTLPGEQITVTVEHQLSFGPLADIVNSVKSAFFGGGVLLPSSTTVNVSARGREE
jgi:Flp pilus assembly protein TadG